MSFLLVGDTKFVPDWCFSLFKQLIKKRKVVTVFDIAKEAEESAFINHVHLFEEYDGTVHVPKDDWSNFLMALQFRVR